MLLVSVMSKPNLLKKYKNLESKVYQLYGNSNIDVEKISEIVDNLANLIEWTERLDDNNQLWCKNLEIQFSYCLDSYFYFLQQ